MILLFQYYFIIWGNGFKIQVNLGLENKVNEFFYYVLNIYIFFFYGIRKFDVIWLQILVFGFNIYNGNSFGVKFLDNEGYLVVLCEIYFVG